MIGQPVVEQVMRNRLGDAVSYNEHVISIAEEDDSVTVMTSSGRTVRSKYAVGADGARSFVRNTLDISFTGTKPEMTWAVLDTFLDTDFPVCPEIITFELDGESRVAWIPRERGMSRFYVLLKGEITQQLAEQSIREHLAPYRVEFTKTEWFSTFHGISPESVISRILIWSQSRNGLLVPLSPRKVMEESSWPEMLLTFIPSTAAKA